MRVDGLEVCFRWDCPSRVNKTLFDNAFKDPVKQKWLFTFKSGYRTRWKHNPKYKSKEMIEEGYKSNYFNPFCFLIILGFFIGLGFSISWGKDNEGNP